MSQGTVSAEEIKKGGCIITICLQYVYNTKIPSIEGNENNFRNIVDVAGNKSLEIASPYLKIQNKIKETGEIYFDVESIASNDEIEVYNSQLDKWERDQGYEINVENGLASINSYEQSTLSILSKLLELSKLGNQGQKEYNQAYLKSCGITFEDDLKKVALQNVFVNSHVLLIYGAAGTGKTCRR